MAAGGATGATGGGTVWPRASGSEIKILNDRPSRSAFLQEIIKRSETCGLLDCSLQCQNTRGSTRRGNDANFASCGPDSPDRGTLFATRGRLLTKRFPAAQDGQSRFKHLQSECLPAQPGVYHGAV